MLHTREGKNKERMMMDPTAEKRGRRRLRIAVCPLCNQLARPILDSLCYISSCQHVFHYPCLWQRSMKVPRKTKLSCPVCTKEFKSMRCIKRLLFLSPGSGFDTSEDEEDHYSANKAKRLKAKLSDAEASLKQQSIHLHEWKKRAETAEVEKDHAVLPFQLKVEELSKMKSECSKLQKRVVEMDAELGVLRINADLDLHENEMTKIESIVGQRMGHNDLIFVLKRALALRNQHLKDLKFQSDLIAKEAKRTLKKYVKGQEKMENLKTRLEEMKKTTQPLLQ